MSRRNRSGSGGDSGGGGSERRGLGATIKRILKIKAIILLILIVLSVFGVIYIIDWVRERFSSGSAFEYVVEAQGENAATIFADFNIL